MKGYSIGIGTSGGKGVNEAMPPPPTTLLHKDFKDIY